MARNDSVSITLIYGLIAVDLRSARFAWVPASDVTIGRTRPYETMRAQVTPAGQTMAERGNRRCGAAEQ